MQELAYLFSIGFSGSDLTRALWIGLVASLFASKRLPAWKVTILAFIIDRIWPFIGMRIAGTEPDVIWNSVISTFLSAPDDAAYYLIRYLGFLGLIYLGYNVRRLVHNLGPSRENSAYPY